METFEGTLQEGDGKHHKKHWVSQSNLSHFRDIRERHFSNGKTAFCDIEKSCSKTL